MKLGAFLVHSADLENDYDGLEAKFRDLVSIGLYTCQLNCYFAHNYTDENALKIKALAEKYGVEITAFWCGAALDEGPCYWNALDGPLSIGIAAPEYRERRIENLLKGARFAKTMGVDKVITHVGFISEYPGTSEFRSLALALKYVLKNFKAMGQTFLFETGQETPITLLRMIEAIDMDDYIGINLDPSNLITYGKGNPIDALTVFGKYVKGVHAKDGNYPTYKGTGGNEVPIGEGMVDFPRFIAKLREVGYDGPLTIEREITGEQQRIDIIKAKEYLEKLI